MQTDIQCRGFTLTRALSAAVTDRLDGYRERIGGLVQTVSVRLFDANGPRGGVDKGCLVEARLPGGRAILVSGADSDLYRAIGRAFSRLEQTTVNHVARARAARRMSLQRIADAAATS